VALECHMAKVTLSSQASMKRKMNSGLRWPPLTSVEQGNEMVVKSVVQRMHNFVQTHLLVPLLLMPSPGQVVPTH
jgi:hypothetical protein